MLEHLDDVEFIVIGSQIGLVQSCSIGLASILKHSVGIFAGDQTINSCSSFGDHLDDLLIRFGLFDPSFGSWR